MKVHALRGVCIGIDRHLAPGETADVDAATAQFLIHIKAVEKYVEPAEKVEPIVAPVSEPIVEPVEEVETKRGRR